MGCGNCFFNKIQEENTNTIDENELRGCSKLSTSDWLSQYETPEGKIPGILEIRFKNTRKEFFLNPKRIDLSIGDIVVVDAKQGYDVGIVSLKGSLAEKQLRRKTISSLNQPLRNVGRRASFYDIEKWKKARKREYPVMIRARQIAKSLNLDMKIGDVEFQGDGAKAIFYYLADDRVDFRELIKLYAREFFIKIEMKQIGARQEAAKIGGIGSCGRELCCSTWRTDFTSISAAYARIQELPINAQKLAGQCGKLKCCLTYELETYLDAREEFPKQLIELETEKGIVYPVKIDVLKKLVWYSTQKDIISDAVPVPVDRIKEVIALNKRGIRIKHLVPEKDMDSIFDLNDNSQIQLDDNGVQKKIKKGKKRKKLRNGNIPKQMG